jgi:hypothetical protein
MGTPEIWPVYLIFVSGTPPPHKRYGEANDECEKHKHNTQRQISIEQSNSAFCGTKQLSPLSPYSIACCPPNTIASPALQLYSAIVSVSFIVLAFLLFPGL